MVDEYDESIKYKCMVKRCREYATHLPPQRFYCNAHIYKSGLETIIEENVYKDKSTKISKDGN